MQVWFSDWTEGRLTWYNSVQPAYNPAIKWFERVSWLLKKIEQKEGEGDVGATLSQPSGGSGSGGDKHVGVTVIGEPTIEQEAEGGIDGGGDEDGGVGELVAEQETKGDVSSGEDKDKGVITAREPVVEEAGGGDKDGGVVGCYNTPSLQLFKVQT